VDAGLAGLTYPTQLGGAGLTPLHQEVFTRVSAGWRLPNGPLAISHGMCLPMLAQFGTEEQKARYLPDNISAETIWCQMFSEPGAGSDVAGLSMRAVRDGEEWILDGQKVWTSGAHYCDFGIVVARTDPTLPKHQGLSMFIVDLREPGIEVRPLVQISGARGFNEVFFSDARIPAGNLLGEVNQGWNLAVSMLMFERVSIGAGGGALNARRGPELAALARDLGRATDPVIRQGLADLHIREEIKGYIGQRIRSSVAAGRVPGPEGSIAKLNGAVLARRTRDLAMSIIGTAGQAWDDGDPSSDVAARWSSFCISAAGMSIAGGTDEVQRNIIGERVLGLPREPDPFKGAPWQDIPRN
jgi:alkylation response protein AidB-like acyl-CoA dehydrogenase